jgi:hypothetical protein
MPKPCRETVIEGKPQQGLLRQTASRHPLLPCALKPTFL